MNDELTDVQKGILGILDLKAENTSLRDQLTESEKKREAAEERLNALEGEFAKDSSELEYRAEAAEAERDKARAELASWNEDMKKLDGLWRTAEADCAALREVIREMHDILIDDTSPDEELNVMAALEGAKALLKTAPRRRPSGADEADGGGVGMGVRQS